MHILHILGTRMKIFFGCTTIKLDKYKDNYLAIRKFLIDEGHVLMSDWLPKAIKHLKVHNRKLEYDKMNTVMKQLAECDVIIIEDTVSNFSTGFQTTFGIQRKKPVLLLWAERKSKHFDSNFLDNIQTSYLTTKKYNLKNYKKIIRAFLKKYSKGTKKERFHLVIDGPERNYIDWARYKKGKSRTKIIREALQERMMKDEEYNEYLEEPY
jgi:hypothetical protein